MHRLIVLGLAGAGGIAVAACGSASAGTATPDPSSASAGFARNGAAGQLVQISGTTLILSNANGDTTVTYTPSTIIMKSSTGSVTDIVAGVCLTATGSKDASGQITASVVQVSSAVNGACPRGGFGGGGGPRRSPNPSFTPNPAFANRAVARGLVMSVNGTAVTLRTTTGATETVTVPTTVRVTTSTTASSSDLQTGECILATGQRGASGTVAARALSIVPAGPSGCFSGGGFGFGGGGFGGGGGAGGTTAA